MALGSRSEAAAPVYAAPPGRVARSWRERLLHLLLPAACPGCREPLLSRSPLGLCQRCRGRLRPAPQLERPAAVDQLWSLWTYAPPLDAVIQQLKFSRLDYLGRQLGEELAAAVGCHVLAHGPVDAVVPVPLHRWRQLSRGFNQAEEIARPLAARLGLTCLPALRRRRSTSAQSSLSRPERLRNLRGVFQPRRRFASRLQGRRVLLVDDVVTTGATLAAAAAALREAGAAEVLAAVVARTPRGG